MRALTMDEIEVVGGGEMKELPICSNRTNTRPASIWDMRWGDFVRTPQTRCAAGWATMTITIWRK